MNSTERIKAMINHQPFDRCGVSGWVHLPLVDHNVKDMVKATIMVTDYCGWDFVKIMSTGHYSTEALGGDVTPSVNPTKWTGTINRYPINTVDDLRNLSVLDNTNYVFNREVQIAKGIKEHYGDSKPVIATIFTPLTFIQEACSRGTNQKIMQFIAEDKDALHHALKVAVESIKTYLDMLINQAGIDGIFFASQYMSKRVISEELFDEFCYPYDKEILDYIKDRTWFNVLHVHGEDQLLFEKALKYDVQAYSWENCVPGLDEKDISHVKDVRKMTDKILVTGLARHYDYYNENNDRNQLKEFFRKRLLTVINESLDNRVIFAPGCALPMDVDRYVFTLMGEVVEEEGYNHD